MNENTAPAEDTATLAEVVCSIVVSLTSDPADALRLHRSITRRLIDAGAPAEGEQDADYWDDLIIEVTENGSLDWD